MFDNLFEIHLQRVYAGETPYFVVVFALAVVSVLHSLRSFSHRMTENNNTKPSNPSNPSQQLIISISPVAVIVLSPYFTAYISPASE